MKEYCTLVTLRLSNPWDGTLDGSRGWESDPLKNVELKPGEGRLQALLRHGWEVIDASVVPKLSTANEDPRYAFILEREVPAEPPP